MKFEVMGNWPASEAAFDADIARHQNKYRNYYTFSVTFGSK